MAIESALVDRARAVRPVKQPHTADGRTDLVSARLDWFACRIFLPAGTVSEHASHRRAVRAPTLLYGVFDEHQQPVKLTINDEVEVYSPEQLEEIVPQPERLLDVPTGLAASPETTYGELPSGTYFYRVTAVSLTGETTPSAEAQATVVGPTGRVELAWNAVPEAAAYRVYRGIATGAQDRFYEVPADVTNFDDQGGGWYTLHAPPTVNRARRVPAAALDRWKITEMPQPLRTRIVVIGYQVTVERVEAPMEQRPPGTTERPAYRTVSEIGG